MTRIGLLLILLAIALPRIQAAGENPPANRDVPSEEQKAVIEKLIATYIDLSTKLHNYNKWQNKLKTALASEPPDTLRLRVLLGNLFELSCKLEASYPSTQKMWPEGLHEQLQHFIPLARKTFSLADQDTSFRSIVDATESTSDATLIAQTKAVLQTLSPIDANIPPPQP